ncbi:MAG: hypothetical protein ABFS56_06950 [Pseudomonadota bacterium]
MSPLFIPAVFSGAVIAGYKIAKYYNKLSEKKPAEKVENQERTPKPLSDEPISQTLTLALVLKGKELATVQAPLTLDSLVTLLEKASYFLCTPDFNTAQLSFGESDIDRDSEQQHVLVKIHFEHPLVQGKTFRNKPEILHSLRKGSSHFEIKTMPPLSQVSGLSKAGFKSFYVQSRGVSHDYDYQWKKITPDEQQQDDAEFILALNEFLDTEYEPFSLLIARTEEGLCLLITGLRSNRKYFQNRVIINSLAFIFDEDEERKLRGLAVRFLGDEVESIRDKLDQIIIDDDKLGFRVEYEGFHRLFSDKGNASNDGKPQEDECKIGNNNQILLSELAEILGNTPLPKRQGTLVVVTGIKKPDKLANVWRALCLFDKSQDWRTLATQKEKNHHNKIFDYPQIIVDHIRVGAAKLKNFRPRMKS